MINNKNLKKKPKKIYNKEKTALQKSNLDHLQGKCVS